MRDIEDAFLQLLKLGIGHSSSVFEIEDWQTIHSLADEQGLAAILVDGIEHLPEACRPSKEVFLEWVGGVMRDYEWRYGMYQKAIGDLAGWHRAHCFKMMVLKGYSCALNWPRPEHRPCGDIDIWQFGQQREADAVLSQQTGIKIDLSHHHHTTFKWEGILVENHFDFINVHDYKSSKEIERILKDLGRDESFFVEVNGENVYLPSPNLHSLFMIRHAASHFASTYITLRHVLDWAFFVENHTKEIDWEWLKGVLDKYHMSDFFNCMNAICVEDLGFASRLFPCIECSPILKEKVLHDILSPDFSVKEPDALIPRLIYKYRRWYGNGWKQELCYEESRLSGFITNLWAHVLKPRSFFS